MPSSEAPQSWVWVRKCNIRCQLGGLFVDLNGGGGQSPVVIACKVPRRNEKNWETNRNQHWHLLAWPLPNDSRVIIRSDVTQGLLAADGHGSWVRCEAGNEWDEQFQWFMEGMPVTDSDEHRVVSFRSVKYPKTYLDLWDGKARPGKPFGTWNGHGGQNQQFLLWNR
ncbi:hypothetical protein F53441_6345 [Fusarium austroafricanum]|uniref:Ricin B lectin domain-containing protein n=1 Tax=Fusarium austroafricanum TaxID=2364996 RepID=A0A8H4KFX3_9HYPO|nr:hypothetical protein F53441_6345 [Fusarium austroafricanum]